MVMILIVVIIPNVRIPIVLKFKVKILIQAIESNFLEKNLWPAQNMKTNITDTALVKRFHNIKVYKLYSIIQFTICEAF